MINNYYRILHITMHFLFQLAGSLEPQEVRTGFNITMVAGTLSCHDNKYVLEVRKYCYYFVKLFSIENEVIEKPRHFRRKIYFKC